MKKRVLRALELVELSKYKNKKAKEFSGGMLRRLHMACAIAHTPKLIIMDEPTVGIDPQSRNHILQSVKKLRASGSSIIYTSHYMEEVEELCDEICILDKGKVIAKGSSEYLKLNFIQNNIYNIVLKEPIESIEKYIKNIEGINSVNINGREIICSYSKEINIIQKLVNTICNHGGIIENIKNEIPTLESVFLNITGEKLRN